jgi:hypothetical protein
MARGAGLGSIYPARRDHGDRSCLDPAVDRHQELSPGEFGQAGVDRVNCNEDNPHVLIGGDNYYLSADGLLMPARKNQAPPDLKYFNRPPRHPE